MKWFKFDWFGSAKRKELEELRKKNLFLEAVVEDLKNNMEEMKKPKLFKTAYISGNTATLVTNQGDILTKANVPSDFLQTISDCKTEEAVKQLFNLHPPVTTVPVEKEITLQTEEEVEIIKYNLGVFKNRKDFYVVGDEVFIKDVSLAIPNMIVASFIEILEKMEVVALKGNEGTNEDELLEEQLEALKCFWLQLALNPIESSRIDLLNFCRKNDVRITRNGNLVLYRRIVSTGKKDKSVLEFVSQQYFRIKGQKKSPKNFNIVQTAEGPVIRPVGATLGADITDVRNLHETYTKLTTEDANTYTSYHNAGRYTIQIGSIYRIPESEINMNNGLCAAGGLHAAAVHYNYSGFGDTPVVVLVSPSKAITVPRGETGKLRTTEMFVACVNDKPQGQHFDEEALATFDAEYNNITIQDLENQLKGKVFEPMVIRTKQRNKEVVLMAAVTKPDVRAIKKALENRIKAIV